MLIFRKPILFILFSLTPFISSCQENARELTTLILVRHAEKAAEPADNPSLTEQGSQRAELLKEMLSQVSVDAIYSTRYNRTRETVAPLAQAQGKVITEYDPSQDPSAFLTDVLKSYPGKTVVICGHSNTIPVMLNRLTGTGDYAQLDEMEYEDLFIVTVTELGNASVTDLTYQPE